MDLTPGGKRDTRNPGPSVSLLDTDRRFLLDDLTPFRVVSETRRTVSSHRLIEVFGDE